MEYLGAVILLIIMAIAALLSLINLPGNWIMLVVAFIGSFFFPQAEMGWIFFILFIAFALIGEGLEFGLQLWGAKKYGSSKQANMTGMIGAVAGAVLGMPILFGAGAIAGALLGAWIGCYVGERLHERPHGEAVHSANGALLGKFLGMAMKFGTGIVLLVITYNAVWPK